MNSSLRLRRTLRLILRRGGRGGGWGEVCVSVWGGGHRAVANGVALAQDGQAGLAVLQVVPPLGQVEGDAALQHHLRAPGARSLQPARAPFSWCALSSALFTCARLARALFDASRFPAAVKAGGNKGSSLLVGGSDGPRGGPCQEHLLTVACWPSRRSAPMPRAPLGCEFSLGQAKQGSYATPLPHQSRDGTVAWVFSSVLSPLKGPLPANFSHAQTGLEGCISGFGAAQSPAGSCRHVCG